jgi:hypothetical protein
MATLVKKKLIVSRIDDCKIGSEMQSNLYLNVKTLFSIYKTNKAQDEFFIFKLFY